MNILQNTVNYTRRGRFIRFFVHTLYSKKPLAFSVISKKTIGNYELMRFREEVRYQEKLAEDREDTMLAAFRRELTDHLRRNFRQILLGKVRFPMRTIRATKVATRFDPTTNRNVYREVKREVITWMEWA